MAEQPLIVITRTDLRRLGEYGVFGANFINIAAWCARPEWILPIVGVALTVFAVGIAMVVASYRWKRA